MLKKRIIPVLLTNGQSLVKGDSFNSWRTVGSVMSAARVFSLRDVDELVLLDVSATAQNRTIDLNLVSAIAEFLRVPFSVGGGVNSIEKFESILRSGADKVILGTSAILQPDLIRQTSRIFGTQAVTISLDVFDESTLILATNSGKSISEHKLIEKAIQCEELGAGEIIIQSISRDGLMNGMAIELISLICATVSIPVVASSGAGSYEDFEAALTAGASGCAAGAIFQFTQSTPREVREILYSKGLPMRS